MIQNDYEPSEVFHKESIRNALKLLGDVQGLGKHPLAKLRIVEIRRREMGRGLNTNGLGTALRDVLSHAIDSLKPSEGKPDFGEKNWWHYTILRYQFVRKHSARRIWIGKLHISKSEYYRQQSNALEAVAEKLHQWEDENQNYNTSTPFHGPPLHTHELVGRIDELNNLRQKLFSRGKQSTVALVGKPGIGKTAIALELAYDADIHTHFHDGILWAKLGQNPNVLGELGKWAAALGISQKEIISLTTVEKLSEKVQSAIGLRYMLLIIDDAWNIDDCLAFQIGGPNCARLLTTRLPEIAADFAEEGLTEIAELDEVNGLTLLSRLAPSASKKYLDEAKKFVKSIGGIPLGIRAIGKHLEKASHEGQESLLTFITKLNQAEEWLKLSLPQVPAAGHPSLPEGLPMSLMVAFEVSERALDINTQRAFWALSVFPPKPNTFSQAAAIEVSDSSAQRIISLAEYGLLEASGERLSMHQAISEFSRLKLSRISLHPNEQLEKHSYILQSAERHSAYYVDILQNAAKQYVQGGDELIAGIKLFDLEWENIQAGQEWAAENSSQNKTAAKLCVKYPILAEEIFLLRHFPHEQIQWMEAGLKAAIENGDLHSQGKLFAGLGRALSRQSKHGQAVECYGKAIDIFRETGDKKSEGRALGNLGLIYTRMGRPKSAFHLYYKFLKIARNVGDRQAEGNALGNLGIAAKNLGNLYRSSVFHNHALVIAQEMGDYYGEQRSLVDLGNTCIELEHIDHAIELFEKALKIADKFDDKYGESDALGNLGRAYAIQEKYNLAIDCYSQSLIIDRDNNYLYGEQYTLYEMSKVHLAQEEFKLAIDLAKQAKVIAKIIRNDRYRADAIDVIGQAYYGLGDILQAIAHGKKALEIYEASDDSKAIEVRERLVNWQEKGDEKE